MPGVLWINVTFVGSILCGMFSGILQGAAEGGVRKARPGEFPPSPADVFFATWKEELTRIRAEMRERSEPGVRSRPVSVADARAAPAGATADHAGLQPAPSPLPSPRAEQLTPRLQATVGCSAHAVSGRI